jgi:hypothetical protein
MYVIGAIYYVLFSYVFGTMCSIVFGVICTFINNGTITVPQQMRNTRYLNGPQLRKDRTVSTFAR